MLSQFMTEAISGHWQMMAALNFIPCLMLQFSVRYELSAKH